MQKSVFNTQLARLKTQWVNSYGPERELLIWKSFEVCRDEDFVRAVEILLSEERGAPLIPQFERAVSQAESERRQRYVAKGFGSGGFAGQLESVSKRTTADPEFVKACMQTLNIYLGGGMPRADFVAQCDLLDRAAKEFTRANRIVNLSRMPYKED